MAYTFRLHQPNYQIAHSESFLPIEYEDECFAIIRDHSGVTLICDSDIMLEVRKVSHGWRLLELDGEYELDEVGIMAEISAVLKSADISIFVVSAYLTDYIFVKDSDVDSAQKALEGAGHQWIEETR